MAWCAPQKGCASCASAPMCAGKGPSGRPTNSAKTASTCLRGRLTAPRAAHAKRPKLRAHACTTRGQTAYTAGNEEPAKRRVLVSAPARGWPAYTPQGAHGGGA